MEIFEKSEITIFLPMRTGSRFVFSHLKVLKPDREIFRHEWEEERIKNPECVVTTARNPFTRWRSWQRWSRAISPNKPVPEMPPICRSDVVYHYPFCDVVKLESVYEDIERIFGIKKTVRVNGYKTQGEDYHDYEFFKRNPEIVEKIIKTQQRDFEKFKYSTNIDAIR